MEINIIDLGIGNVRSIKNWIEKSNIPVKVISKRKDINSNLIILPGVGSAGPFMKKLKKNDFDKAIIDHFNSNKRIIGICLGYQIMSKHTEEDGGVECLNLIDSSVTRLDHEKSHNGWENFTFIKDETKNQKFNTFYSNNKKRILKGRVFYNHEFGVINHDKNAFNIPISKQYQKYTGFYIKNNIIGIQFHPEKSQVSGLELSSMIV